MVLRLDSLVDRIRRFESTYTIPEFRDSSRKDIRDSLLDIKNIDPIDLIYLYNCIVSDTVNSLSSYYMPILMLGGNRILPLAFNILSSYPSYDQREDSFNLNKSLCFMHSFKFSSLPLYTKEKIVNEFYILSLNRQYSGNYIPTRGESRNYFNLHRKFDVGYELC